MFYSNPDHEYCGGTPAREAFDYNIGGIERRAESDPHKPGCGASVKRFRVRATPPDGDNRPLFARDYDCVVCPNCDGPLFDNKIYAKDPRKDET